MMEMSRRSLLGVCAGALALAPLAACSSSDSSKDSDSKSKESGSASSGKSGPKRVAALEYAAADVLVALGLTDRVVALPQQVPAGPLQKAFSGKDIARVGSMVDVSTDKLAATEPDLILYGGRQQKLAGEFKKIADDTILTQVQPGAKGMLAANRQMVEKVAGKFGRSSAVSSKLDALDKHAAEVKKKAGKAGKTLFVITSGGKVAAFGPGGRWDIVFNELGLKSGMKIDPKTAKQPHGQPLSMEDIAKAAPDTIFVLDRDKAIGDKDAQPAKKVFDNSLVKGTPAGKKNRLFYVDPGVWYLVGGGLEAMETMISDVEKAVS